MILTVDIGNTTVALGFFSGDKLCRKAIFPSKQKSYFESLEKTIKKQKIKAVVICSVVPTTTRVFCRDIQKVCRFKPIIIGEDLKVPIKNLYREPKQVGQDRLVNAYAGIKLFGAPLIAVDFGTAVTFDVVSKNAEYLGGMILPGIQLSLEALHKRTALLPKVELKKPKELIGKDTDSSIISGIVHGFAAMSDELVSRIKEEVGQEASVVATGGDSELLAEYCREIKKIEPNLTLVGLNILYNVHLHI